MVKHIVTNGKMLVLNYKHFNDGHDRKGSEKDVEMLDETFSDICFEVTIEKDLDKQQTIEKIQEFIENLDDQTDMIVISINSHSNARNSFCTAEKKSLDIYSDILNTNRLLTSRRRFQDKPMWLIINACQGNSLDLGLRSLERSNNQDSQDAEDTDTFSPKRKSLMRSSHSQLLISQSTVFDFVSFRNEVHGSRFIEELTNVLNQNYLDKNLRDMLDMVADRVSKRSPDGYFQCPIYTNIGLTKKIYFSKKASG